MELKNVYSAFVKAQKGFAPALKTSTNPHFKSKYADLAACVEAVIDSLNANGIGLIQRTHQDDTGVTVETVFVHESGETLSGGTLHVPAPKQDPQGYGSALSYARRYSLMAACGIAPEDDDGNAASKKPAIKKGAGVISATDGAWDRLTEAEKFDAKADYELIVEAGSPEESAKVWMEITSNAPHNDYPVAIWGALKEKNNELAMFIQKYVKAQKEK